MNKLSEIFRRASDSCLRLAQDRGQLASFGTAAAAFYAFGNVETAYVFAAMPTVMGGLGLTSLVLAKGTELAFPPEVLRTQKLGKAARQFVASAGRTIKKSDIMPALSTEDATQILGEDATVAELSRLVNASRLTTFLKYMTDEESARLYAFESKEGDSSLSETGQYSNKRSIVEAEIYANIAQRIDFEHEIKKDVPYWAESSAAIAGLEQAGAPTFAKLCAPQ